MSGVLAGTEANIGDTINRRSIAGDTGTFFAFGIVRRGPTDRAIPVTSYAHLVRECGEEIATSLTHGVLESNFRLGLGLAYVARLVGDAAEAASGKVKDGAGEGAKDTLEILASSEGEWGNDVDWKVAAGATPGTFRLQASYQGDIEV